MELYADAEDPSAEPVRLAMSRGEEIRELATGWVYRARVPSSRLASDYTVRVLPFHPTLRAPIEERHIAWQR